MDGAAPELLAPGEVAPGRPFAAPDHTRGDLAILREMRANVARHVRAGSLPAADAAPALEADGTQHWLCVPRPRALVAASPVTAVGFFGQARPELDHAPILEREHDIVARAASFGGLLTYYNLRLADGRYGNLVLFDAAPSKAHVTGDRVHAEAVALTPRHYHSLRLHHARLPEGVLGDGELELVRTRYLDFSGETVWHAVREPAL